ncbi:hypothetical protein PoB_002134500 [Plakobranchus ocellatus]|uniref:Uncharacterized protein n=1 Tax=Plakobranchus ocellatus TaxID=259542 RepID=A0AAV3ZJV0_9GAST|nr:hypothetical protein PoB_002134500 [Plakobranchus ocellatus]
MFPWDDRGDGHPSDTTLLNTLAPVLVAHGLLTHESGTPTYVYRGCHDSTRDDGCVVVGDTHNCYFSCKDRGDCNGQVMTRSPLLDSDAASTLTPLSSGGLLVSVGSFCTIVLMRLTLTKVYG